MAKIVFLLIICLKEILCEFNMPLDYFPQGREFGENAGRGYGTNEYYTPSPKRVWHPSMAQADPSALYDLDDKITRAGKWPEFLAKVKETGDKVKGKVMKNWEEDAYKWAEWAQGLEKPAARSEPEPERPPLVTIAEPASKPSMGMEMYWGENERVPPPPPQSSPASYGRAEYGGPRESYMPPGSPGLKSPQRNQIPIQKSSQNMMSMALKKLQFLEKQQKFGFSNLEEMQSPGNANPHEKQITRTEKNETKPSESEFIQFAFSKLHQLEDILQKRQEAINATNSTKKVDDGPFSKLPKVDDFDSPIIWVPFNSDDTADGIAKVTDAATKKNKQYTINGTIYVPVIDYDLTRLGLTTEPTTVSSAILAMYRASTEPNVLRTVLDNVDMQKPSDRDWLAFETILGGDRSGKTCEGGSCQARCRNLGCQTQCDGDTCAAGCVGPACNSLCNGQGCSSMCIGESCIARCDGLTCDARCRGKNCEASCQKPSCFSTINGQTQATRSNWNDYYPMQGGSSDKNYE